MINYQKKTLILDNKEYPIQSFQVWWLGPLGLVPTLEQAESVQKSLEIDDAPFHVVWKAVPVAVCDGGIYEQII